MAESLERLESPFRSRGGEPPAPPPSSPSSSSSRLALRPMTGYEEEFVERHLDAPNTARLCNELLARCLVPPGSDATQELERVRDLLVARRDEALLELRRLSLGDVVHTSTRCPACEAVVEVDFRLGQLPIPRIEAPPHVDVALEGTGAARMRLPTAGDQEALLEAGLETEAQRRTWVLARVLLRLGQEQGPFTEEQVRALPTRLRTGLEQALEKALPALDLSMAVTCQACGQVSSSPFDVSAFFLPR